MLWNSGVVLRCVWVPSGLQLASPMSRVVEEFSGSQARAEVAAWAVWDPILVNHMLCEVRGVTRLREPGVYLVRDPKAVGGAGRGGEPPPPPLACDTAFLTMPGCSSKQQHPRTEKHCAPLPAALQVRPPW